MKSHEFCYWLQGYFEIGEAACEGELEDLNQGQTALIKKHLALVFKHEIDPKYGNEEHQAELDEIHDGGPVHPPEDNNPAPFFDGSSGPTIYRC